MFGLKPKSKKNSKKNQNKLDDAFKEIISNGDILARILRGNIDELGDMGPEEIKKCLKLGDGIKFATMRDKEYFSRREGKIILDSAFNLEIPGSDIGVIIGVEGQGNPNPGYPLGKRAEYYVARMVSAQRKREFKGSDYGKMKKVYSIWCILNPKESDRNTITRYSMKAENVYGKDRPMEKLDTFNVVFINVGDFEKDLPDALGICAAMFSDIEEKERKTLVKDNYNIELSDEELEGLKEMVSLYDDAVDHGIDLGMEKGRIEGRIEGKTEGIAEERAISLDRSIESMVNLVRDFGLSFEQASSALVIPEEDRAKVEAEAKKRLKKSS